MLGSGFVVATVFAALAAVLAVRARERDPRARLSPMTGEYLAVSPPLSLNPTPFTISPQLLETVRDAHTERLRQEARRWVGEFRGYLDLLASTAVDGRPLGRALEAHRAAELVMLDARTPTDLVGVFVLLELGYAAAVTAQRRYAAGQAPIAPQHCFFNPLHGRTHRTAPWHLQAHRLTVPACETCANDVALGRMPDTLRENDLPYFEADPALSVWAATGYGAFEDPVARLVGAGRS